MKCLSRREVLALGLGAAAMCLPLPGWARGGLKSSLVFSTPEPADLYCTLRWGLGNREKLGEGWKPALDLMAKAAGMLPGRFGFSAIDGLVADAPNVSWLVEVLPDLPETGPSGAPVREPMRLVVQALSLARGPYRAELLVAHKRAMAEALKRIRSEFVPKEDQLLEFVFTGLRLPDKGVRVPVLLVGEAPSPGAFTVRSRKSGAVCFVGVNSHAGTLLYETMLHESIHALEVAAGPESGSVLDSLRRKLASKGVAREDALMRDVPHALFFVHAGFAIRRYVDGRHRDYGEVTGLYERTATVSEPVLRHWHAHLGGGMSADEAVSRIVDAIGVGRLSRTS